MKKTKLIAGIAALSIMMTGAGYAMWNQEFTVQNNVDTGYLTVTTTAGTLTETEINGHTYTDASATSVSKENGTENIVVNIDRVYPGAELTYDFTVTNTGTMAVKLDDTATPVLSGTEADGDALTEDQLDHVTVQRISDNEEQIEPGSTDTLQYRISFDDEADNDLQNATFIITTSPKYVQFNQQ